MKFALLALAVVFLHGCSLFSTLGQEPWLEVALVAQSQIEYAQQGEIVYVVPDAGPRQARHALSQLRKVVHPSEVASVRGYVLPPGHVIVRSFEISGESAFIAVQGGPIVAGSNVSCGYNMRVPVRRVAGRWLADYAPIVVC